MTWKGWAAGAALLALLVALVVITMNQAQAQTPAFTVEWTAPGDDGNVGTASMYELRISTTPVGADTTAWWAAATPVAAMPTPALAGTKQSKLISTGLSWGATYYILIVAWDDGLPPIGPTPNPNRSGWSNVASYNTGPAPDITPPRRITDLLARP